jgi:O-antigen/teichoic acid export membrane protein
MKNIKEFFNNFINRSGGYVFLANVSSRLLSFFASWLAIKLIPNEELGIVLFSYNIIGFILPFSGAGIQYSLIRYAPFLKKKKEKIELLNYVLKKGVQYSIIIFLFVILFSCIIPFKLAEQNQYLAVLAMVILPDFIFQVILNQLRVIHKNKLFAISQVAYNSILASSVFLLTYFFAEKGYAAALIITPLLTALLFIKKIYSFKKKKISKPKIVDKTFWKYGFSASLSNVVTQIMMSIDLLLIGFLIPTPETVTIYRYIAIIPVSFTFLPIVFMNTDFVTLTEKIRDKEYLYKYIKNYITIFIFISIGLCTGAYIFSKELLSIFDSEFVIYDTSFLMLTIGVSSILILRGLFGNLLYSIGRVNINLIIVLIAIVLNIIGDYYYIPLKGIQGAVYTSTFIMWFTSISSAVTFFYYYKKF